MKIFKVIIALFIIWLLQACENRQPNEIKQNIAVSIYPLKAIISEITGDKFDIDVILPVGASPHIYEPKPSDLRKISKAKTIFYVSNNFDKWVAGTEYNHVELASFINEKKLIIEHDHSEHRHEKNINSMDPHVWLSPQIVRSILPMLTNYIIGLDTINKKYYKERSDNFDKKLAKLQDSIAAMLSNIRNIPIYTFHNSFAYFIREFGLTYGGSIEEYPGKEAGTKYVVELTRKISQANIKAIFCEPQLNPKAVETIAVELGLNLAELDPIGGTAGKATYFELILTNAGTLKNTLK